MIYKRPELPVKPVDLVPEGQGGEELTPKTRVVCINRSDKVYVDKYDGRDYRCPPGLFEVEFEVANHFRERSVVPGTRDPITGKQERFIAILGIDPDHRCAPLTKEESEKAEQAVEAIDREAMEGPAKQVKVIPTQAARARTAGGNRRVRQAAESNDGTAALEVNEVLAPPVGGDAMQQIARDAAAKAAEA